MLKHSFPGFSCLRAGPVLNATELLGIRWSAPLSDATWGECCYFVRREFKTNKPPPTAAHVYGYDFRLQTGGCLAWHSKHCLAVNCLFWSPWALDCCCEIVSQLVINYFIKSLFFSFPHHYFHLVSFKLNPFIGKACFSPKWGLGFAEKNIDLRKDVLLTHAAYVHTYAYIKQEITVCVFKCCSGTLTLLSFTLEANFPSCYLQIHPLFLPNKYDKW